MAEQTHCVPGVDSERRRISLLTALALLGGATITITGCGGGETPAGPAATPSPSGGTCPAGSVCGFIPSDPSHTAVITSAQLTAGGALVLNIQGTQNHNHTVSLSADEVVAIRDRRQVQKTSSIEFQHSHLVTFN